MPALAKEQNMAEVVNKQPEKEEQWDSKHSITAKQEEAGSTTSHNGEVFEEIEEEQLLDEVEREANFVEGIDSNGNSSKSGREDGGQRREYSRSRNISGDSTIFIRTKVFDRTAHCRRWTKIWAIQRQIKSVRGPHVRCLTFILKNHSRQFLVPNSDEFL